ncbi:MAG: hypothetical protein GY830_03470 [Bacteroidetes bacterium]|nr:hypothetical protein [Bacteroidota bacterium]
MIFLTNQIFKLFLTFICLTPNILFKKYSNDKVIARVGDIKLFKSDLSPVLEGINNKEKQKITQQFINEWVKKHLIISEAKKIGSYNKFEVERKKLDYEYALIIHDFIENSLKDKINYDISDEEIEQYYNENRNNFELKENIVKGRFAVIPRSAKNSNNLLNLFLSSKEEDIEKLKSYCQENAKSYFLNSSIWFKFDDMINETPLENERDKLRLVKRMNKKKINKVIGKDNIYYFQILKYKISNEVSPIEFVTEKIKNKIIHKNKVELRNQLLKDILDKAKKRKNYEIY